MHVHAKSLRDILYLFLNIMGFEFSANQKPVQSKKQEKPGATHSIENHGLTVHPHVSRDLSVMQRSVSFTTYSTTSCGGMSTVPV